MNATWSLIKINTFTAHTLYLLLFVVGIFGVIYYSLIIILKKRDKKAITIIEIFATGVLTLGSFIAIVKENREVSRFVGTLPTVCYFLFIVLAIVVVILSRKNKH